MALIDGVEATCRALAAAGWRSLLLDVTSGGLDISAPDLAAALAKPVSVDLGAPGFEDFAAARARGIEPGRPAYSLLYHALASPCVQRTAAGGPLTAFPSLAQIEAVEDYVYGAVPPTVAELRDRAGGDALVIAVFAVEYRPAARTPHRAHADLCTSRTGIARVGTAPALYDAARRQFEPLDADDPFAFRVLPVRYAPFVAVRRAGAAGAQPARFVRGDDQLEFLLPLHKLFAGDECISGLTLTVELSAFQRNEKLRRLHAWLEAQGYDTGWSGPVLDEPPFRFDDGIAGLSPDPQAGRGLLVPDAHGRLIEPAEFRGAPLAMRVPAKLAPARGASHVLASYFSGLEVEPGGPYPIGTVGETIAPGGQAHASPEIVNARHKLLDDGREVNLNDAPGVQRAVEDGGYRARHYVDFTGDGWIAVDCPELDVALPVRRSAYSIVSGPDFFPYCDQLQLMEWWPTVPDEIRDGLWALLPRALSDTRFGPNVTIGMPGYDDPLQDPLHDRTITAVVCSFDAPPPSPRSWPGPDPDVRSGLPDAAGGVFKPGWDVTTDALGSLPGTPPDERNDLFLTAYGLGTPFVEDVKICASLATYWPAVAPDSTRTYQPDPWWPTISPLTDEEIGIEGDLPWDGLRGPRRIVPEGGAAVVEYLDIDYADYVDQTLAGKLTAVLTSRIDFAEYTRRVTAMAWIYWALDIRLPPSGPGTHFQRLHDFLRQKATWSVLGFKVSPAGADAEDALRAACAEASGPPPQGAVYWASLYRHGRDRQSPASFRMRWVEILEEAEFYVGADVVLVRRGDGPWQRRALPTS
jgi:hypothetical protein